MGFSTKQLRALRRNPDSRFVRTRQIDGRQLSYLEGWYAISEANRIFGFDAWSSETVESRCVLSRESRGSFIAVYIARVRITVVSDGTSLVREGHGTGEGHGTSPGEVHDVALKAAETDATKRALATFGRPFGLELYRSVGTQKLPDRSGLPTASSASSPSPVGFHPDDTTPIPRPSRYYGRPRDTIAEHFQEERKQALKDQAHQPTAQIPAPPLVPSSQEKIDKSQLPIGEPKRLRDKNHLRYVASQPCLICGRQPCDPHHVRFAQPRAFGMKVSDEFTVPLCRTHHRQLHQVGNEQGWWVERNIKPLEVARKLWDQSRPRAVQIDEPRADGG